MSRLKMRLLAARLRRFWCSIELGIALSATVVAEQENKVLMPFLVELDTGYTLSFSR